LTIERRLRFVEAVVDGVIDHTPGIGQKCDTTLTSSLSRTITEIMERGSCTIRRSNIFRDR
jgi:hypothetical protein